MCVCVCVYKHILSTHTYSKLLFLFLPQHLQPFLHLCFYLERRERGRKVGRKKGREGEEDGEREREEKWRGGRRWRERRH